MEEKIKEIVEKYLGVKPSDYTNEANFVEDLAYDSLDMVEIIMACESDFRISIPDDIFPQLKTVQNLIDYIKKHAK
jgi:acyl carrier protein